MENVLDGARVRGLRTGENPARWRGHLDKLLPKKSKLRAVKHFVAMPIDEMPAFMRILRKEKTAAARALEFTILTAARTGETLGATLSEIDGSGRIWTIWGSR